MLHVWNWRLGIFVSFFSVKNALDTQPNLGTNYGKGRSRMSSNDQATDLWVHAVWQSLSCVSFQSHNHCNLKEMKCRLKNSHKMLEIRIMESNIPENVIWITWFCGVGSEPRGLHRDHGEQTWKVSLIVWAKFEIHVFKKFMRKAYCLLISAHRGISEASLNIWDADLHSKISPFQITSR